MGIIDRATNGAEVIRLGPGIFYSFQKLDRHRDWGSPENYDVEIFIDEQHLTSMSDVGPTCINGYVIPKPKAPLNVFDLAIKEHFDLDRMKWFCKSPISYQATKTNYRMALAGRGEKWFNFESGCKNEKQKAS